MFNQSLLNAMIKGFGENLHHKKKIDSKKIKKELIIKALKFHSEGNIKLAVKYYKSLIIQGYLDPVVFSNYGAILQQRGYFQQAINLYEKSIKLFPNSPQSYSNLGSLLRDQGEIEKAEILIRKSIDINPDYAESFFNLGSILFDKGQLEEAQVCILKAIKLKPNLSSAYSTLYSILRDKGQLEEAQKSIVKAIKLDPDRAYYYLNLASLLREKGQIIEAEKLILKALKISPEHAEAYCNLGSIQKELGDIKDAEKSFRKSISLKSDLFESHYNLGCILNDLGNTKEAELSFRRSIEFNPNFLAAYVNLGTTLRNLGQLKAAENFLIKAIKIKTDIAKAYFVLSTLNSPFYKEEWEENIFSETIFNQLSSEDKIDIYFARSNILHKKKNYTESTKYLKLANNLKLQIRPVTSDILINKSKEIFNEFSKLACKKFNHDLITENIFIVGMPRSGTTLLESIISINPDVEDLGEANIFEESYFEWIKFKGINSEVKLKKIYSDKVKELSKGSKITTNKWLYNYQYAGIISCQISNSKIIHCYRNPLDNILSIYRAHFAKGNSFSSSLEDCAKVYLDQLEVMNEYKKIYNLNIYNLNYDLLVTNPNDEIKKLIAWLDWEWDDLYLSPHLNKRTVSTASSVQVRSPINARSLGSWINYREMLEPAIQIIKTNELYKDLIP